jgi:hypothetical protein
MTTATILGNLSRTVDEIDARARRIEPRRVLLVLVAVVPFLIGWSACMVWRAVWTVLSWTFAAVVFGWKTGNGSVTADEGG